MNRLRLDQLPPRLQEQAYAQMAKKADALYRAGKPLQLIRQKSGDGMNKTERAFLAWLKETYPSAYIHREVSLPVANGVRYKVDFLTVHTTALGATVCGWEVKGYMRDDAAVKIKCAAQEFRWISFKLVSRVKGGGWHFQDVKA